MMCDFGAMSAAIITAIVGIILFFVFAYFLSSYISFACFIFELLFIIAIILIINYTCNSNKATEKYHDGN